MSVIQRVVKPVTRKGKKVLISREPQLIEAAKNSLFFQGRKTSEKVRALLSDLYDLKKPHATKLSRKNDVTIFENVTPVEQFCRKHESPLFVMGSHSKKRPDNIVMGRMFDYSLLDMIELGINDFESMKSFQGRKIIMGCKPSLIFNGVVWEQNEELKQLKSLLIDFFHREDVESIRLQGLEHAISFTITSDNNVLMRSYKVLLKKSGCKTPRIELEEIGPRVDFSLRRSKLPTEDLMKQSLQKPKELRVVKKKNISTDGLGTKHGRIHLGVQDVNKLQTRKMKGLRKSATEQKKGRALKRAANELLDPNTKKIQVAC